jgi:hypothetical protein
MLIGLWAVFLSSPLLFAAAEKPHCALALRAAGFYWAPPGHLIGVHYAHRVSPLLDAILRRPPEQAKRTIEELKQYLKNRTLSPALLKLLFDFDLRPGGEMDLLDRLTLEKLIAFDRPLVPLPGQREGEDYLSPLKIREMSSYYREVLYVRELVDRVLHQHGFLAESSSAESSVYVENKTFKLFLDPHRGQLRSANSLVLLFSEGIPVGLLTSWGYVPISETGLVSIEQETDGAAARVRRDLEELLDLELIVPEQQFSDPHFGNISVGPFYRVGFGRDGYLFSQNPSFQPAINYLEPVGLRFQWENLPAPRPWKSPD